MSPILGILDPSPPSEAASQDIPPARMLILLIGLIFITEMIAMWIINVLAVHNPLTEAFLDGLIMLLLIFPGLYFLQLQPLLKQIKERTRAEQNSRANEQLLTKILELLPVGVSIVDMNGKMVHGNPASWDIWVGTRYIENEQFEEFKAWLEGWAGRKRVTRGEISLNEEIEIQSFTGVRKVILNSTVPINNNQNQIIGSIIVNEDVTQRKQQEKALIQTNELLEKVFLCIDTQIAYLDRDFNFVRVNENFARYGGFPPEYYVGKKYFDLYPNQENQVIFRRVVETGEPFSALEKPLDYGDHPERGVTYWDWNLQPVLAADGIIEGLVFSLVDVTQRKHAELQLERQNLDLRELSNAEHKQRELVERVSAAAQALTQTLELDHVINTLLDHLLAVVDCDTAQVTMMEGEGRLVVRAVRVNQAWADRDDYPTFPVDAITDSVIQRVKMTRKSLMIPNTLPSPYGDQQGDSRLIHRWLVLPIIASDQVIGLVEIGKVGSEFFPPEHNQWAEALVGQAAVAIQNAWLFEQVRSSSERLQSLARKLVEVQEYERFHIARELHDEAGQALSSLKISLGRLEQDPDCPPQVSQKLLELKSVVDCVLEDLHRLAMDLRPLALDHLGLVAALEQLAINLNSERLSVRFKAVGFGADRLSQDMETSLYRIVQEALTNIMNHAQASRVGILLERGEGVVKLFVEDDGIGFAPESLARDDQLGLVGMRERAEMLHGSLSIESSSGSGTSIIIEVPG